MSPNVGNFVHDLVEMAKAMETLPQVEAERDRLNASLNEALVRIENREVSILTLKAEIETLNAKVRQMEAERDDAEIRFLELDEKAGRALSFIGDITVSLDKARQELTPKPMPELEAQKPEPVYTPQGWANSDSQGHESTGLASVPESTVIMPVAGTEQGQGEANPPINDGSLTSQAKDDTSSGPYANLRYYDHPTYVPFDQWIAGGGSEEDYHWRPIPQAKPIF